MVQIAANLAKLQQWGAGLTNLRPPPVGIDPPLDYSGWDTTGSGGRGVDTAHGLRLTCTSALRTHRGRRADATVGNTHARRTIAAVQ